MFLPYDTTVALLTKKKKKDNLSQQSKNLCSHKVLYRLNTKLEKLQCPSKDGINCSVWCIHSMEYYSTIKRKNLYMEQFQWISGKRIMLEIGKANKKADLRKTTRSYLYSSLKWQTRKGEQIRGVLSEPPGKPERRGRYGYKRVTRELSDGIVCILTMLVVMWTKMW